MEVRDLDVQHRLILLIDKACNKRNGGLDAPLLSEIKTICRQSDANVLLAWDALWPQLKAPHAQVRRAGGW